MTTVPLRCSGRPPATPAAAGALTCLLVAMLASGCGSSDEVVNGPGQGVDIGPGDAKVTDTGATQSDAVTQDTGEPVDSGGSDGAGGDADAAVDTAGCVKSTPPTEVCNGIDDDCDGSTDDDACPDGATCTIGKCDGTKCTYVPTAGPCEADDDACTEDACKDGACSPGAQKTCDDNNPCTNDTCDPKSGACGHGAVADGGTCDDGNACTEGDTCNKGSCTAKALTCDDSNVCTQDTCDPKTGCANTVAVGGCDDGDKCTDGDACDPAKGGCVGGKAKDCDDSNPCTTDSCDALSGACVNGAVEGACDDGSLCTTKDTCVAGACKGSATDCNDGNPCTNDSCDAVKGCVFPPIGAPCDDGNKCTDFDVCDAGTCKGKAKDATLCDDNNPCTADSCAAASGCVNLPTTATCTDGDACTTDACQGGSCTAVAWTCGCKNDAECAAKDDDNLCNGKLVCDKASGVGVCKVDPSTVITCDTSSDGTCLKTACDPKSGQCSGSPQNEGKPCDADGSICTAGDACKAGACAAGAAASCDDNNPCTTDSCDDKTGCAYLPNQATCDADGDACTVGDGCKDKLCVKGSKKSCDDDNPCTVDSCDDKTGQCVHAGAPLNGAACDADGSFCTAKDACDAGTCKPGKALPCDDNNPCTDDACQPKTGCVHVDNAKPCDADGDPCTENDTCSGKVCKAGPTKACDDGKKCTADTCEAKTGKCLHKVIVGCGGYCEVVAHCDDGNPCTTDACTDTKCVWTPKIGLCDDGNACTVSDGCDKGVCAGLKKPCDDGNVCTNDGCQPASGCVHLNNAAPCNDFDGCTQADQCKAGKCAAGVLKKCDDGDKCTTDACNPSNGACVHKGIAGCGGYCNTVTDCNDNNACTDEVCDKGKCVSTVNTKTCDDGSQCTAGDACKDGKCIPGKAKVCDDKDPCTVDGCDPKTAACTVKPGTAGLACDDSNPCTDKDVCAKSGTALVCKGGAKSCDDANACTADSCDSKTGKCAHKAQAGSCEDGDPCTAGDACANGLCVSGAGVTVETLAGGGAGFVDGKGAAAKFKYPYGVAVLGDVTVVADASNHRIRAVAKDGTVTTLAGTGKAGLLNGKGSAAFFNAPYGVATSVKGEVFVADRNNHAIRRIAADGTVSTLAGTGVSGSNNGSTSSARLSYPYGVAAAGDGSAVVVADTYNHRIRRVAGGVVTTVAGSKAGFANGKGTAAKFYYPIGVAVDGQGVIYVADQSNHRIRRVAPDGVVTTLAGSGSAGFLNGGAATARFYNPWGIAVDAAGVVWVGDRYTHRIRRIEGGVVTTWAGSGSAGWVNGKPGSARFYYPAGVAVSAQGVVVVADGHNHRVRRIVDARKPCHIDGACWTEGSVNPKSPCLLCAPAAAKSKWTTASDGAACQDSDLCTTSEACKSGQCAGSKLACDDKDACTLDTCDAGVGACSFKPIVGCGGNCAKDGDCNDKNPCTTDACTQGKCAFSAHTKPCDDGNACTWGDVCAGGKCTPGQRTEVTTFTGNGSGFADGDKSKAKFRYPRRLAVHPKGGFVLADGHNHRIRRIDAKGTVSTLAGSGAAGYVNGGAASARFYYPTDVAVAADGTVVVADLSNHRLRLIDPKGNVSLLAGSSAGWVDGKGASARFHTPYGLDRTSGGVVYVADAGNHRVRKVTADGVVTTLAGSAAGYVNGKGAAARFNYPIDIAVTASGALLVADYNNNRIRKVTAEGVASLVAGSGVGGYLDGGSTTARFNRPWDVLELPDGRVLVADRYNHRLREISTSGLVTRFAGTGSASYTNGDALTTARFREPWGLAVDAAGTVFVADYINQRVRAVRATQGACTIGGLCYAAGVRQSGKPCASCDATKSTTAWSATSDGGACSDGDYCTASDACAGGACKGKATACDDSNKCSADSCDAKTGACAFKAIQGCDGWCQVNADCDDGNPCVTDTCEGAKVGVPGTCKHTNNVAPCDDKNSCTAGDVCQAGKCQAGTATWVTTLAGSAGGYVEGDAAKARMNQPHGLDTDTKGDVWFADRYNHKVRKVSGGQVSLVAGGKAGYANGGALTARFNDPVDVAFGAGGVLYICDRGNHRIRALDAKGQVTTLAGSNAGYANGKGANARFNNPYGIDTNAAGTLFVADYSNHRVRRVSADGTVVTLAGSAAGYVNGVGAAARFHTPIGVVALPGGDVVAVEHGGHRLRRITPAGLTTLIAGSGKAGLVEGKGAVARFNYPRGVAWSPQGYLVVADQNNHRLRKVTLDGVVTTFAGAGAGYTDGPAVGARFNSPRGVTVAVDGTVTVGDAGNQKLRQVRPTALPCLIGGRCWANGTRDPAAACSACDGAKSGSAWTAVADGQGCADGKLCTLADACASGKCAGSTNTCDDKDACTTDACDATTGACTHKKIIGCKGYCELDSHCDDGNPCTLGATCKNNQCAQGPATYVDTWAGAGKGYVDGPAKSAKFNNVRGLAVDAQGRVWVADHSNHRVRRIAADGTVSTLAGSGKAGLVDGVGDQAWFNGPSGLAVDVTGTAYIADRYTHSIRKLEASGKVTTLAGNGSAGYNDDFGGSARFNQPTDVAVAPDGMLFVADAYNHRIRRVEPDGTVHTQSGIGIGYVDGDVAKARFRYPIGVARGADGMLFVADYGNHRIRKVTPDGTVTTIAGSGTAGGLNGTPDKAQFYYPWGIAVDSAQRVFVMERNGHRLRRVTPTLVDTVAGVSYGYVDGPSNVARFYYPSALTVAASGTLYVGDDSNGRVRRVRVTASACHIAGACWADGARKPGSACTACLGAKAAKAWSPLADKAVCDDGSACTLADTCKSGACEGGTAKVCNDNNKCTVDSCSKATGACAFKPTFDPNCTP